MKDKGKTIIYAGGALCLGGFLFIPNQDLMWTTFWLSIAIMLIGLYANKEEKNEKESSSYH